MFAISRDDRWATCHDGRRQSGDWQRKGEWVAVDLSAITRPVGRLVATAQNGLEVLRYGGLETGAVPSPFQIIESVPMYRLRRYFPPDSRPGATPAGPPVLMVHPMMMSADMWDVTRDEGAVGILHAAGVDPWVIDFGSPDQVEGPGQHRRVRLAGRHPGGVAPQPARQPRRGRGGLHGRPRLQSHRHPRL